MRPPEDAVFCNYLKFEFFFPHVVEQSILDEADEAKMNCAFVVVVSINNTSELTNINKLKILPNTLQSQQSEFNLNLSKNLKHLGLCFMFACG